MSCCPRWPRSSWMRSSKGVSLPRQASTDRAPATNAAANMRSHANRPASASAVETWVPLMSASPSFARSSSGASARVCQGLCGRQGRAADARLALADQHSGQMRERRQVARRARRALAGNDRNHIRVEELKQRVDDFVTHPGMSARQRGDLEQERQAHHRVGQRLRPVPAECDNTSARCSSESCVASMCVRASSPKPVLTP